MNVLGIIKLVVFERYFNLSWDIFYVVVT